MKRSCQCGFTLIEGLLTVLVISLGFLAVTRLQLHIWRHHLGSTQTHEAMQLGFDKLNEQRQQITIRPALFAGGQDRITAVRTHYQRNWTHSPQSITGSSCQVVIDWGQPPDTHSLSLKAVIGEISRTDNGLWISRFD